MNQLAKRETEAVVVREEPQDLLRLAVEKGANVETIERLMAVRRELNAERAKKEFDDALAAFQRDCPIIEKKKAVMNKGGQGIRYHYAPLDAIIASVKGLLHEHGFSYSLDTITDDKGVKSICKITHRGGHSQTSEFRVPIDPTAYMNAQQQFASALTFAKRYAFCNGMGIMTADADLDANTHKEKPAGPSKLAPDTASLKDLTAQLWSLLKPVRGPEANWREANQWMWDNTVIADDQEAPRLDESSFKKAIEKAKAKLNV